MKYINLSGKKGKGLRAIVDDEDFEKVKKYKWYPLYRGITPTPQAHFAYRNNRYINVYMSRLILNPPRDKDVDHINGNDLDNRRNNLRLCTQLENGKNLPLKKNNTSGYKGVSWHKITKNAKPWFAKIKVNYKTIYLGTFTTKIAASKAYNKAAKKYFGEFVREASPRMR